jgi:hypothetical protein
MPPPLGHVPRFPMRIRRLAAALAVCAGLASAAAQEIPAGGLYGAIRNAHYTAPDGRFRLPVPVLAELGGKVFDTEAVVTFTDDVSTHVSVACFPLGLSQQWELETRGLKDFLAWFYGEHVFMNFSGRFPGAANESSVFTPDLRGGALLVFTLLPGGSAFAARANVVEGAGSPQPVAKRGTVLFVANGCAFVVSTELAERVTQRSTFQRTADEENDLLRQRLIHVLSRLQAPAPGRASPRP